MPCLTLLWAPPTAHPAPQGTVGLWAVPPRTNVQVGVQGKWRVHQPVLLLVARLPVHNVAFGFLVSQGDGGNLEGESSMRPDPEILDGRKEWQHSQGPDAGGWGGGGVTELVHPGSRQQGVLSAEKMIHLCLIV